MRQKKICLKPSPNLSHSRTDKDIIIKKPLYLLIVIVAVFFIMGHPSCWGMPSTPMVQGEPKEKDKLISYGDAFVTSSIADARTLIPILASDSASGDIVGLLFNGLVKYDKNIELTGDLAGSWDIKENGLVIIFHLKRHVKWHDGRPFTAEDVKFTYDKLIDPDVPTPYSGDFKKVKSFEIIDPYTIKITYKEPFSPGLASWGMPIMPKHILKKENLLTTKFSRHPVGTGPYKFKRWKTAERIDLEANEDYFEHCPYITRYISRIIPDITTTFLELITFNIDSMGLSPIQYRKLTNTKKFSKNYNKFKYPSFGYTFMAYNLKNPLFKDKRVRQAFNYAVNKDEIIKGVLLGLGSVSTGPFIKDSWAYNENVKSYSFSPDRARSMLKQAGWKDSNGDGWLDKNGRMFEFTIITNQGNELRIKTAEIIQRRLKEIGVKVNIRVLEWAVFLNEFINKNRFEAVILGWSLSRDPDSFDIWHSSKTKTGEFNFIHYANPEIDKLLVEGRRIFDKDKRAAIYAKVHEILYDDQPYMFLYVADSLPAVSSRFKGIEPAPIGIGYNFIDWYVPKTEQRYQ